MIDLYLSGGALLLAGCMLVLAYQVARRRAARIESKVYATLTSLRSVIVAPNEVSSALFGLVRGEDWIVNLHLFNHPHSPFEIETGIGWCIHFALRRDLSYEVDSVSTPDGRFVFASEWGDLLTPLELMDLVDPAAVIRLFDLVNNTQTLQQDLQSLRIEMGSVPNEHK